MNDALDVPITAWARFDWLVAELLQLLKVVPAVVTFINVSWHNLVLHNLISAC